MDPKIDRAMECCSICLDPLSPEQSSREETRGVDVVALPCSHAFHRGCILHWTRLHVDAFCPLCRLVIPPHCVSSLTLISPAKQTQEGGPAGEQLNYTARGSDATQSAITRPAPVANANIAALPRNLLLLGVDEFAAWAQRTVEGADARVLVVSEAYEAARVGATRLLLEITREMDRGRFADASLARLRDWRTGVQDYATRLAAWRNELRNELNVQMRVSDALRLHPNALLITLNSMRARVQVATNLARFELGHLEHELAELQALDVGLSREVEAYELQ